MANNNFLSANTSDDHLLIVLSRDSELRKESMESFCYLLWFILVDCMTNLIYDHKFEFALHLCNSEFLVHPVAASKEQLLWYSHIKEALSEPFKPTFPIVFSC